MLVCSMDNPGAASSRPQITHVIFDLDGLLLDTESLYTLCTQKILDRYGKTYDWPLKTRVMGRKPLDAAGFIVDALELPISAEEFHTELYSLLGELFPDAEMMPGGKALIKHLHTCGIPLAVATSSATSSYELKVSKKMDTFSCFGHTVCSDDPDVKHGKPAPDIYFVAASRFASIPKSNTNVLVFEDAPNGVAAAKAAGMTCVMVPDRRTDPEKCKQADKVLSSLELLDLTEWGLPPLK